MANRKRKASAFLKEQDPYLATLLDSEIHGFDFFQAVRLLDSVFHDWAPIGESSAFSDDPIRFGQVASLAFAPSANANFNLDQDHPKFDVYFFGLFGPNGPLPAHLTQYAQDRADKKGEWGRKLEEAYRKKDLPMLNEHDTTFVDFANIFHHRMLSLFYRAWANGQPTVGLDRANTKKSPTRIFESMIRAVVGIHEPPSHHRDALADDIKLFFAGRFSAATPNAEGLIVIIRELLDVPAQLVENVEQWLQIPSRHQWQLGGRERPKSGLLGGVFVEERQGLRTTTPHYGLTLGSRVRDFQHKFRIDLGPLEMSDFQRFMPSITICDAEAMVEYTQDIKLLSSIVQNYLGDELSWQLKLTLHEHAFKPPEDQSMDEVGRLVSLAWYLATNPAGRFSDADRAISLAQAAAVLTDYRDPRVLRTLAAANAAAGNYSAAIDWCEKAIKLSATETNELSRELASYRNESPWREPESPWFRLGGGGCPLGQKSWLLGNSAPKHRHVVLDNQNRLQLPEDFVPLK